ncbi:MAG: TonB-dependent receptor plug domain-containing protein, partial [Bacteroidota bacterium]
ITALPASTNADESANPALRGSASARSRVIFNGVPIYNPVRSSQLNGLGLFSIFNTELVEQQNVYASNPPLTYGNSSGGLVEIITPTTGYDNWQVSTSLASVGGFLTQTLGKQDQGVLKVFGNWQFSDAFVEVNRASLPELEGFGVVDGGAYIATSWENWQLKAFSYAIHEDFAVNIRQFGYRGPASGDKLRHYHTFNLSRQTGKNLFSTQLGWDQSRSRFYFGNTASLIRSQQQYAAINWKRYESDNLSWQVGLNYDGLARDFADTTSQYWFAIRPDDPVSMIDTGVFRPLVEGHVYLKWDLSDQSHLSGGLRQHVPFPNQQAFLSGQLAWRQDLGGEHSFLLSGGRYHSYSVPGFFFRGNELLRADQVALDYAFQPAKAKYTAAVFAKREQGLQLQDFLLIQQADILGLELFGEQDLGDFFQLSLAYTRLWHRISLSETNPQWRGNQDFPWFCKASASFRHPLLGTASLSWIGRSGRVFIPITGANFRDDLQVFEPQFASVINGERLPAYHNLSLSLSRVQDLGHKHSVILFLNINNLPNRFNVREYGFSSDFEERFAEPFSLRNWYFGAVWNFL